MKMRGIASAWAMTLLVTLLFVGCLPPSRDNVAPVDATATDADGASVDDTADSQTSGDAAADDGDADDAIEDATDDMAVQLPKGCTEDSQCAGLALGGCLTSSCNLATGTCSLQNVKTGTACETASLCEVNGTCKTGVCVGTPIVCDDENPCTTDACAPAVGCTVTQNHSVCDDSDPCTLLDRCEAGACVGTPRDCPEAACSTGVCNKATGECNAKPKPAKTPCDDGVVCTIDDICIGQSCSGSPNDCNDNDPCTLDSCPPDLDTGCVHFVLAGPTADCTDADPCTAASCVDGSCVKAAKDCDDKDPCTSDTCSGGNCAHQALLAGACSDGDPCTIEDACVKGQCKSTQQNTCDDANVCTTDSCVPFTGCSHKANFQICNDGSACTAEDACTAGVCVGKAKSCDDSKPCTIDSCDSVTGICSHETAVDGTSCDGGTCAAGVCKGAGK